MKAGKTLSYYNENAKEFAERTVDVDFSENYSMFLGTLKKGGYLLWLWLWT